MFVRILVPLDGSTLSEFVVPHARRLALALGIDLDLVSAIEVEDLPEDLIAEVEQDRDAYLGRVAGSLPAELEPRCILERGQPAEVIIDRAKAREGTLVVMATHGYSGLQRWFLGGVAHKVVQGATSPVLLIPPGAKSPEGGPVEFDRVIIPLDGSPLAEHVLPYVVALSRALQMESIVLRVYNPRFPGATIRMHEVSQIVHDAAERYVEEKARQLRNEGLTRVSYEVLRGIPAQQITDFALATPNSLTAMCTHGKHGVGRWVLGSVTDAVIHCLEEPVLVVHSPH